MIPEAIFSFLVAATISSRQFCDRGTYFVDKTYSENPEELETRARSARQVLSKRFKAFRCLLNSLPASHCIIWGKRKKNKNHVAGVLFNIISLAHFIISVFRISARSLASRCFTHSLIESAVSRERSHTFLLK